MRNAISRVVWLVSLILSLAPLCLYGDNRFEAKAVGEPTRYLKPYSQIDTSIIPECSGIVKSRIYDDLYWVHSDSGHPPLIFPIRSDGTLVRREGKDGHADSGGIQLADVENIDWEDISADGMGNLIIADTGNNRYNRDDLTLLIFPEPDPLSDNSISDVKKIRIRYPERKWGRRNPRSFDAEALFWLHGRLYLATKQLSGSTRLYMVPSLETETEQELIYLGSHDTDGMITAADGDEHREIAVFLTYSGIWIFTPERGTEEKTWKEKNLAFADTYRKTDYLPIAAGQCEALCIADDHLLIVNEGGAMFKVPLRELEP